MVKHFPDSIDSLRCAGELPLAGVSNKYEDASGLVRELSQSTFRAEIRADSPARFFNHEDPDTRSLVRQHLSHLQFFAVPASSGCKRGL